MANQAITDLPSLEELGVDSGHDSLRPFVPEIFAPDAPQFLSWGEGELVAYSNKDLHRIAAMPEFGFRAHAA